MIELDNLLNDVMSVAKAIDLRKSRQKRMLFKNSNSNNEILPNMVIMRNFFK